MSSLDLTPEERKAFENSPLIKALSKLETEAIMPFLEPRSIPDSTVIFEEGDFGDEMFILVSGMIDVWVLQADGTQRLTYQMGPGDFFGEMSIIAKENRSATITANCDLLLLAIHGTDFYRLIFDYPMIGVKILTVIRNVQNSWLEQNSQHLGDIMRWGETARRRAVSDELTGLYNRRFLDETAKEHFEKGIELRSISLLMMDMDKIHDVNSVHGVRGGDLVLIATADALRANTRDGDICARLSGDEFAILLPDAETGEAILIAEKIRLAMAARKIKVPDSPTGEGHAEITVFASIGVATAPFHADSWETLQLTADKALRHSKELGRNRVEVSG